MGDLDLPFEGQAPAELGGDAELVAGVVVMAAVVPVPEDPARPLGPQQPRPAVVFRFPKPDGSGYHPAMVLVGLEPHTLPNLPKLVQQAVNSAEQAARA